MIQTIVVVRGSTQFKFIWSEIVYGYSRALPTAHTYNALRPQTKQANVLTTCTAKNEKTDQIAWINTTWSRRSEEIAESRTTRTLIIYLEFHFCVLCLRTDASIHISLPFRETFIYSIDTVGTMAQHTHKSSNVFTHNTINVRRARKCQALCRRMCER